MRPAADLLVALLTCHEVRIRTDEARPGRTGETCITSDRGATRYRRWSRPARAAKTHVRLRGARFTSVSYHQRRGETVEALLWRALAELSRRERAGMPTPKIDPTRKRRRELQALFDRADTRRPM